MITRQGINYLLTDDDGNRIEYEATEFERQDDQICDDESASEMSMLNSPEFNGEIRPPS